MIHMGSLVGAGISQFESKTFGIKLPFFSRFRNSEDRRNFISAGAAAGIASAFCAPVGGLLFAFEEVSSYWSVKLSWQTFFCCMVSSFTTALFGSCFEKFEYNSNFGSLRRESSTIYYVEHYKRINVVAVIPSLCLGLIGGGLGSVFTYCNLKLARLRRNLHARFKKRFPIQSVIKILEPAIIMTIVVVSGVSCQLILLGQFSMSRFFHRFLPCLSRDRLLARKWQRLRTLNALLIERNQAYASNPSVPWTMRRRLNYLRVQFSLWSTD